VPYQGAFFTNRATVATESRQPESQPPLATDQVGFQCWAMPRLDYNPFGELPIDGSIGADLRSSAFKFECRGRTEAQKPLPRE